jgi:hypothetical protein
MSHHGKLDMNDPSIRQAMKDATTAVTVLIDKLTEFENENGGELPLAEYDVRRLAEDLDEAIRQWVIKNEGK